LSGVNASQTQSARIAANVSNMNDLHDLAEAINAKSGQTGVTASVVAGSITLVSETGDDIAIDHVTDGAGTGALQFAAEDYDGATNNTFTATPVSLSDTGNTGARLTGRVLFSSPAAYSVGSTDTTSLFTATTASSLNSVASIDVSSQVGSNQALVIIDSALGNINGQRAKLGAIENRVESTITNLQVTHDNLEAARSRIQDADFAEETAALTRSQVLQQAGIAMTAQANQLPQQVLQLLRQ
jgi:flagellin